MSTSKFINVDKETGEVLNSFQFTNKQTGFNLKIFKVYDFSTDELLITADGTYNNNLIGYSANSNNDAMLLILNLTSQLISQNSVWDWQNGVELATSVEYDSDYIYSFGQKDNTYLFLKKHNITSLELINQKIYLPTTVSPQPEGSKVFYSYGMFQNKIVWIYMSYIDEFSLTLFDKNTLNLFKNWQIGDYLKSTQFPKIWVQLDSHS